uniref:Sulfotransferase domain-containing protein n=1 Tax=Chaetoceros debilis TaxID=122233 RepID=A0A7S3QBV0_9STRA
MKRSPATTTATSAIANVHLLQYYFKCVKVIGPLLYLLMMINNFVTVRYQIDLESAAILEVGGSQSILKLKGKDGSTNSRTLLEDGNVASGSSSEHMYSSRDLNTNTSSDDISICWLMSYPNSGTSFTMGLAQIDSNRTAATNYPLEAHGSLDSVRSLYPTHNQKGQSPRPPFILHPHMNRPSKYILTKTHCAGPCIGCKPKRYRTNAAFFAKKCQDSRHSNHDHYEPQSMNAVKKVVHLVRDPMDNAVSNYHLELKKYKRKGEDEKLKIFTNDREGFRKFCKIQDAKYVKQEQKLFGEEKWNILKDVPCHASFFKYAQWHSRAYDVTTENTGMSMFDDAPVPRLNMFYEDYRNATYHDSKAKLFTFLELEDIQERAIFHEGKTYRDEYFTKEEITKIMKLIKFFAIGEVWDLLLQRYDY